jgi:N-methylhydantoinase B
MSAAGSLRDPAISKGRSRALAYCDFELKQGDVLYVRAGSGGGYGDPLERDPRMVERDVGSGILSPKTARSVYGVVLDRQGRLKMQATEKLRDGIRSERVKGGVRAGRGDSERIQGSHPGSELVEGDDDLRRVATCSKCQGKLSDSAEWRDGCLVKALSPTEAGPLMKDLVGHFELRQLYCPSCGALLETELKETQAQATRRNRRSP